MSTDDRKNDLEFSEEELSALEQSRQNRSTLTGGRPRRKSHHKGLRVPADVVPRHSPPLNPQDPAPRSPSTKTLPLGVPIPTLDAPASLVPGPRSVEDTDRVSLKELSSPAPEPHAESTASFEPEDAPTEPFLSAMPLQPLSSAEVPISVVEPEEEEPEQCQTIPIPSLFPPQVLQAEMDPGPPDPSDPGLEMDHEPEAIVEASATEASATEASATEEEEGDTVEIPPQAVQQAVQDAIKAASEAVTGAPQVQASGIAFDVEEITMPGASEAMEELAARQMPGAVDSPVEEEGERANRVAILLSALQSPARKSPPAAEVSDDPSLDVNTVPLRPLRPQPEAAPQTVSPFPLARDLVTPPEPSELEELSGEDLEEDLEEVSTDPSDDLDQRTPPPPPIPDPSPLSPFVDDADVEEQVVRVPLRESEGATEDDIMTSAMAVEDAAEAEPPPDPELPAAETQDLAPSHAPEAPVVPAVVPVVPATPPTPSAAQAQTPAVPPAVPTPALEVPRLALARGRKRKKAWFEEIFDEDWLRTLKPVDQKRTAREADFLEESLQPSPDSEILDLGCGSGRHTIELAGRGYKVTGYDLSLPLLIRAADEAQRRNLQVNFVHGDFREFAIKEQFDAVFCLGTTFGYFDDDSNRKMIHAVNQALRVGGRFLLDVVNRDYGIRDLPARIWWEGEGSVVLEEVDFNYFTSRIVSKRSVVFEDGRHLEQEFSIRSYSLHELGKILHHAGFRVLEVSGHVAHRARFFGNNSRSLVLLAEKRAQ